MSEYVITLLAAAAVTYILTPVVRRFAVAVGAMHAARERDVHEMPTPLLGGFAIYGGLVAGLVVVVTMNAVNFIDGLDGLAAGIVGIGAIAFFAYYFTLVHRLELLDQTVPALVSALLAGVCIGFLPHNFYPARIFMGDTGSMLIGLMLAYAPISSMALLDPASLTDTTAYAAGTVNRYGAIIPLLVPGAI